jgi:hypothetical protein
MDPLIPPQDSSSKAQPSTESDRWRVPDLIDFDFYIDVDEQTMRERPAERNRLAERDRKLYLEKIRDPVAGLATPHSPRHRSVVLRRWLEQRRRNEDPALRPLLPGASFARSQRLVTLGLGFFGCVIGAGVASILLQYDGQHPVNVSWYLFVLVLLQILLAVATVAAWALRRSKMLQTAVQDLSLLSHLIRPLFSRVAGWVHRQRVAHVPADVRERAKAKKGLLQSHYALYGAATYLPILVAAQVFGIGFNLGAIATTVALEWFSDLAFGWGSALDVQPQTIHELARFIALPWSWAIGEGLGYPTLEQIAGSRISLKDPLSTLDAGDLRAWRWFLVLAVVAYGLLPRLALLGLSVLAQARTLAALPFTHQRTQAVYARMVTPSLETAVAGSGTGPEMPIPQPLKPLRAPTAAPRPKPPPAPERKAPPEPHPKTKSPTDAKPQAAPKRLPEDAVEPPTRSPEPADREPRTRPAASPATELKPRSAAATAVAADACVLMIHVDVADLLDESDQVRLQQMLLAHTGWRVAASVTIGGGSAMADQALALMRDGQWEAPPPRIAIVQDGSQPPITEHLRFLRAVRAQAGEQAPILLALVGDPEGEDPLPPLSDFDFGDWQRKVEQMADPYLRLEMLSPPANDPAPEKEASR